MATYENILDEYPHHGPTPVHLIPIASLKGIGPEILKKLEKIQLFSVQDLLFHLPLRYEDRTQLTPLACLKVGHIALIQGRIEYVEAVSVGGRRILVVKLHDGTGFFNVRLFHYNGRYGPPLQQGQWLRCYGEVREGYYGLEFTHPDYERIAECDKGKLPSHLTPIYPLTEGLYQKFLRKLIARALAYVHPAWLPDWLPDALCQVGYERIWKLGEAIKLLHRPPPNCNENSELVKTARQRLAMEELLAHHLSFIQIRRRIQSHKAPPLMLDADKVQAFLEHVPFVFTHAQKRVIHEIEADITTSKPMMRLLQGDVGSGKTVVAARIALLACTSGYQVAVMVPTELLSEQHTENFRHWLEPIGVEVVHLSGRVRGKKRHAILEKIASGQVGIVIGTHALFQEEVQFCRLGLVIIDEQHRFGVQQRLALRAKGMQDNFYPHQLIMTATPIPRTLAMLGYADLDVSVLDELPPGRIPVKTIALPTTRREELIGRLSAILHEGQQVYWVCTLIEESESLEAEAAEKMADWLIGVLPSVRVGLAHGKQKLAEREAVMSAFKQGKMDILVATTVIEVGVDVPNASIMVIENAERLGLTQLHQLRGRVGRGSKESHCVLLYRLPLGSMARERLNTLRECNDGFFIAEKDLVLRGPGELFGTRQTGELKWRVAKLASDFALADAIQPIADCLFEKHREAVGPLIDRWVGHSRQYVEV